MLHSTHEGGTCIIAFLLQLSGTTINAHAAMRGIIALQSSSLHLLISMKHTIIIIISDEISSTPKSAGLEWKS